MRGVVSEGCYQFEREGTGMNSFRGKMLVVDLTEKSWEVQDIPASWVEKYLGQKGMGARSVMADVPPENVVAMFDAVNRFRKS